MIEFASFGAWLKHRRRELDLTQAELARRAGCSKDAIRKIEADERKPSQQLAGLLARELQIPQDERKAFIQYARHILPEAGSTFAFIEKPSVPRGLPPHAPSNNLPAFLTYLVDRTRDIAAINELITSREVRWVTLAGPPGIGKTRLSIHCGEQVLSHFRDGVWFVDLSAILDAGFVLSTIGRTLSHLDLPQSPTLEQLIAGLKEKELLLILDNFEHVEAAAGETAALLKGCPNIKLLVSSRVPLNIYGEYIYDVPALSVPLKSAAMSPDALMQFEAVQLFVARARQFQSGFKVNQENAQAVVTVCTRMDGIPLALELAAASLRTMPVTELAQLLRPESETNWLKHIGHQARDLPPRQQTLENVIAWSYTLLSAEQQAFFRRLGIFTGWFESEAAATICYEDDLDASHARSALEYLTEHSLLQQSQFDGQTFWHMLDIIHEFALLQTTLSERRGIEVKHAHFYHSLLQNQSNDRPKPNRELFFQINGDNLHQALRWAVAAAEPDLALSLASALCDLWEHVGYLREGLDLIQQVIAMPDKTNDGLEIEFLNRAATLAWQQHHFDLALSFTGEAIEIAKYNPSDPRYALLLNLKGRIFIEQEKYAEAQTALGECYALSLDHPDVFNPGVALVQIGEIELALGNYPQAQSRLKTATDFLKDRRDIFLAMGYTDLAEVALAMQDYDSAEVYLKSAMEIAGQHVRRLLCFLSTLAGYLTLKMSSDLNSLQRAVQIYGAIDALKEYSGEALVPFYIELNTNRIALTRRALEKSHWETAWQTGRRWTKDEMLSRAVEGILT